MSLENNNFQAKLKVLNAKIKQEWAKRMAQLGMLWQKIGTKFPIIGKVSNHCCRVCGKIGNKFGWIGHQKVGQKKFVLPILLVFLVGVLLVAVVAARIGYQMGYGHGLSEGSVVATDDTGKPLTTADIRAIRLENDILKTEIATLTQERDISLNNLNLLKEEVETLKTGYLQLEQLNEVLSKVAIKDGGIPLEILGAQIVALPENSFEYRFDVAMLARDGRGKTLTPQLTLLNATSMVEIPLKPKSYEIQGVTNIRGRFIMPDGFSPRQIRVRLSVDGKILEQLYDWRVGKVANSSPKMGDHVSQRPIGR